MKIRNLNPRYSHQHQQVNKTPSSTMFLGGILLGAMLVMMLMNQNQVNHYTLSDGSVVTTATTMTSSIASHTPPGGIRTAPTRVRSVQSSSSSDEADEDAESDEGKNKSGVPSDVQDSNAQDSDGPENSDGPEDEPEDGPKDGADEEDEEDHFAEKDGEDDGDEGGAADFGVVSYERAHRDSGGFFDDIADDAWALMKQRVKSRTNYFNPQNSNHHITEPEAWYQENFEPDFTCAHERRIGGMGDGPKWVCDPHRLMVNEATPQYTKECLIYSVGSEGNFMFETAVMKEIGKHCEIHTFDPEIQGRPYGALAPEGVNYHNWGFMSETDGQQAQAKYYANVNRFNGSYKTMKTTIEELGHVGKEIDIFKIDCEGCEWTTFKGWFNSGATLRQILVEVHKTPIDTVVDFFTGMQEHGYVTFHKEPNIQYAGGKCVEYAFLKLEESFFQDD